jgi:hypothetical protein
MVFAAVIELVLGIRAEGKSLENVATPLTAIEEATGKSAAVLTSVGRRPKRAAKPWPIR